MRYDGSQYNQPQFVLNHNLYWERVQYRMLLARASIIMVHSSMQSNPALFAS